MWVDKDLFEWLFHRRWNHDFSRSPHLQWINNLLASSNVPAWWQVPQLILDAAPEVWVLGHRNFHIRNFRRVCNKQVESCSTSFFWSWDYICRHTVKNGEVAGGWASSNPHPAATAFGFSEAQSRDHVVNDHNMTCFPVFFMGQHVEEIGD